MVGQQTHDGGVRDPGEAFEVGAALGQGDAEDVAFEVGAEDAEYLGAGDVLVAGNGDIGRGGEQEALVVQKKAADAGDGEHEDE